MNTQSNEYTPPPSKFIHEGYRMRSFTETAWARLLEAAGISYLYESQLVELDRCYYLPDFYLPNVGIFLEVKGPSANDLERQKAQETQEKTGKHVILLKGFPEVDGGGFYNSILSIFYKGSWIDFSMHEVVEAIEKHDPYLFKILAVTASSLKNSGSSCTPIGDLVDDYIMSLLNKPECEQYLASTNSAMNNKKTNSQADPTYQEIMLSKIIADIAYKQNLSKIKNQ